jgi:hypothetical protein
VLTGQGAAIDTTTAASKLVFGISARGITRRFVQNWTLSGQGLEHRTNLA